MHQNPAVNLRMRLGFLDRVLDIIVARWLSTKRTREKDRELGRTASGTHEKKNEGAMAKGRSEAEAVCAPPEDGSA